MSMATSSGLGRKEVGSGRKEGKEGGDRKEGQTKGRKEVREGGRRRKREKRGRPRRKRGGSMAREVSFNIGLLSKRRGTCS